MTVIPAAEGPVVVGEVNRHSYMDWGAIIGGAFVAVAMSLVLTMFGAAIGLSVVSPWSYEGVSATTAGIAAAVWFALVQIYASGLGGYLAGRMRPRAGDAITEEVRFRDGINGLVVWAIAVAASAMLSLAIVSGVARTVGSVASGAASAAGPVAERAIDAIMRPAPAANQGQAAGPAGQASPSAQAGQAANGAASASSSQRPALTEQQRAELARIVSASLARGEMTAEDRTYLEQMVARQTGVSPDVAKQRVNDAINTAKAAADKARSAAAFGGFWTAVVLMLAGLAAWWGGSLGGSHRDEDLLVPR